jgi:hypothetical protein
MVTLKEIADCLREANPKASFVKLYVWPDYCKLKVISHSGSVMKTLDGGWVKDVDNEATND